LELSENKLTGEQLKHLSIYSGSMHTLKLASNKISHLKDLEHLVSPLPNTAFRKL
jgi:ribosomal protein L13